MISERWVSGSVEVPIKVFYRITKGACYERCGLHAPIIKTRGRHYECKIIYKSAMDPAHLDKDYDSSLYPKKDYHTLYFGEILACYETD
jgi:hypothetical protein